MAHTIRKTQALPVDAVPLCNMDILCLKGCVVTIDAMGTQNEIAQKIIKKEGNYILLLKENQETLMEDIALYFEKDISGCKKKELEKRPIL